MTALDEARAAAPWPEWKQVVCRDCGREYTCTPEGVCTSCLLAEHGMNPETTPLRVVDETGHEVDPRDNT